MKRKSNPFTDAIITPKKKIIKSLKQSNLTFSPFSKKVARKLILDNPERESDIIKDLILDSKENIDPKLIGFEIERIITRQLKCCHCNESNVLRQFKNPNYPIYDLRCKNINCSALYQVKSSSTSNYFGKDFITVSKASDSVFEIKGTDSNKKLIPTFILIKIKDFKPDLNKSFILKPNFEIDCNDKFYHFENKKFGKITKKIIKFNASLVIRKSINDIGDLDFDLNNFI
jgi:hypothetical protein